VVPVYGSNGSISFLIAKRKEVRSRRDSYVEEVFDMEMEGKQQTPKNSNSPSVGPTKAAVTASSSLAYTPTKASVGRALGSSPASSSSPGRPSSSPSSVGASVSSPRPGSAPKTWHTPTKTLATPLKMEYAKQPVSEQPKPSKLSIPSSSSPFSTFTPTVIEVPSKLSQKERKRLNRERASQPDKVERDSPETSIVGSTPPVSSPWSVPVDSTPSASSSSPFAMYANGSRKGKSKKHDPGPTLVDIIQQEKRDLRVKTEQTSKSLKDIQLEEEFEKWWTSESQKVQSLAQQAEDAKRRGRGHRNRRGGLSVNS
jgi:hypothetical protein